MIITVHGTYHKNFFSIQWWYQWMCLGTKYLCCVNWCPLSILICTRKIEKKFRNISVAFQFWHPLPTLCFIWLKHLCDMNNKSVLNKDNYCSDYVCTGSGCKWSCKRHDIGAQCGATVTNITAKFINDTNARQNLQKTLKQLVVVSNAADGLDGCVEPDLYRNHPAAFVPSKVPNRRTPPYINILIHEHHITPHVKKVNLSGIENFLGIDI